jgi:type IV pilus assembly protein PilA
MNQGPHSVPPPPIEKKSSTGLIIAIVLGVVFVLIVGVGILAVLAIASTRKYVANAKQAEATSSLGMMMKDAVMAYESSGETPAARTLCPAARAPIPASVTAVAGKKYQSTTDEWQADPGFSCLKFELVMPQYYQYDFASAGGELAAKAKGDLDGDGTLSEYTLSAKVQHDELVIAPSIYEQNAGE